MITKIALFCSAACFITISAAFSQDAVATTAAAAAPEKFYLKESVSIVTDTGVTSLVPGTEVVKIGKSGAGIKVKSKEGVVVVAKETQITTDPTIAQTLASQEAQRQAAVAAAMQRQQLARDEAVRKAEIAASQAAATAPPPVTATTTAPALTRTPIQYEAQDSGVTVHPPVIKKKKKK